jgi:hypothetical protein
MNRYAGGPILRAKCYSAVADESLKVESNFLQFPKKLCSVFQHNQHRPGDADCALFFITIFLKIDKDLKPREQ